MKKKIIFVVIIAIMLLLCKINIVYGATGSAGKKSFWDKIIQDGYNIIISSPGSQVLNTFIKAVNNSSNGQSGNPVQNIASNLFAMTPAGMAVNVAQNSVGDMVKQVLYEIGKSFIDVIVDFADFLQSIINELQAYTLNYTKSNGWFTPLYFSEKEIKSNDDINKYLKLNEDGHYEKKFILKDTRRRTR